MLFNRLCRLKRYPKVLLTTTIDHFVTHTSGHAANAFKATLHNVAAGASEDTPDKAPILDTGATRCALYLDWLSKDDTKKAKRILRSSQWNKISSTPLQQHHVCTFNEQTFDQHWPTQGNAGFEICVG